MKLKINDDVFYSTTADTFSYYIEHNGEKIFNGKAFKNPEEDNISINITKICRDWVENKLPDFRNYTDNLVEQEGAYQTFDLYTYSVVDDIATPVLLNTYHILFDWNYDMPWTGQSMDLSEPVNGHMDSRMKLFYTVYRDTTGETICWRGNGPSIFYTTTDDKVMPLSGYHSDMELFGANVVGNTYINGEGIIEFDVPIRKIGEYGFHYYGEYLSNSYLKTMILPEGIKTIGMKAFNSCKNLESINIPESVERIGKPDWGNWPMVFYSNSEAMRPEVYGGKLPMIENIVFADTCLVRDYSNKTTYDIPYGTRFIDAFAFLIPNTTPTWDGRSTGGVSPTNLRAVTFPETIEGIGSAAFAGNRLTSLHLPYKKLRYIDDCAFRDCTGITGTISIANSVISLGERAFENCSKIDEVIIGNGLKKIEKDTFYGCSSLTALTLNEGLEEIAEGSFFHCNISSVVLPHSLKILGHNCFADSIHRIIYNGTLEEWEQISFGDYWHRNFGTVRVTPDWVYEINCIDGDYQLYKYITETRDGDIFYENEISGRVVNCELTERNTSVENNLFVSKPYLEEVIIPDTVTSIGDNAFSGCTHLTSINFPDTITSIGNSAFKDCSGCTALTIPAYVETIGDGAFKNCSGLTEIVIPNTMTSIGEEVFSFCKNLTSVTIPTSIRSIGRWAFSYCSKLYEIEYLGTKAQWNAITKGEYWREGSVGIIHCTDGDVYISKLVSTYTDGTRYENYIDSIRKNSLLSCIVTNIATAITDNTFSGCTNLSSVTICDTVTSIGKNAFDGCSVLSDIIIPNSVINIDDYAFYNCDSLTSIIIPNSVTNIGDFAFGYCNVLSSVTIGDSVAEIGAYAFYDCIALRNLTIGNSVTNIGDDAFQMCTLLTELTYKGTKAQWNAITKGRYWYYSGYLRKIHCTDGDITLYN